MSTRCIYHVRSIRLSHVKNPHVTFSSTNVALQLVNMVARMARWCKPLLQGNCFALQMKFSPRPDRQRGNGQGRQTGALRSGGQKVCTQTR